MELWTYFVSYISAFLDLLFFNSPSLFSKRLDPKRDPAKTTDEPIDATNTHVGSRDQDPTVDTFPLTEEQINAQIEEFIGSINEEAVCDLASRHRGQAPCTVLGRDRGSFNVCFFVRFGTDDARWVVRVPLEPVVVNSWAKLQSEVATLRFILNNTTIPVPRVRAFGTEAALIPGSSEAPSFLICDYIPGVPLLMKTLVEAPQDRRRQFYSELIDILAQLYNVEFATAGSLMPDPAGKPEPIVGEILSLPANELFRDRPGLQSTAVLPEGQYMAYHHHVLSETYRLPTQDLSQDQVQMELFAIESLAKLIKSTEPAHSAETFVLAHLDLRCHNIIITEDLHIRGIIDWEFSGTIPRRLFTPPPWLTGHDSSAAWACPPRAPILHHQLYPEFLKVLEEKSTSDSNCAGLWEEWKDDPELWFSLAQILRRPSCLTQLYYRSIFPRLFENLNHKVQVPRFFEDVENVSLALEARHRIKQSNCYTQYLKDQGLFIDDDEESQQRIQEFITKAKEVLNK
ncbi:hypothetical protein BHE90_010160 [Fusarium euwallaceae]|uniref:Aminoglycoside phosphotransferase domain-containing protein n=1 Tax=Fusarium euwallaceae TaxID=1147111 RepID=A0A430LI43_9HYPO|nr:hypothetical protein BHE90_010160 [Fusarium euwallaceae]